MKLDDTDVTELCTTWIVPFVILVTYKVQDTRVETEIHEAWECQTQIIKELHILLQYRFRFNW
jgi:hypothetical protein